MIFRPRNGQAALEYLFTYGWAFMVILVSIGALMYFGFFDFDRLRGSDCVFPAGANCNEFYIGESLSTTSDDPEIRIILRNTYGVDLALYELTASSRLFGEDVDCEILAVPPGGGDAEPYPFPGKVTGGYPGGAPNGFRGGGSGGGSSGSGGGPPADGANVEWDRDEVKEFSCRPSDSSWYLKGERYDITFTGIFSQDAPDAYEHELVGWISGNAQ